MFKWWFDTPLWLRILLALVAGAAVGYFWGEGAQALKPIGDVFIRLIRMIVVPLVFVVIVTGVASLSEPARLGSIGIKTAFLYILTTAIAVGVGLGLATWLQPGLGADFGSAAPQTVAAPKTLGETFIGIIPMNPFQALAQGDILSVIFFALMIGTGVLALGETARPVRELFAAGAEVMLFVVKIVMEVAPFGVFALIAVVMGTSGPETFVSIFWLAVCVVVGSLFHAVFVHGLLVVRILANLPMLPWFRGIIDAVLVAFTTSSSAATLPVSLRVAEKNLGIRPAVASTVLPLGTSFSMDGTAMYVAMLALFTAQAFGIELDAAAYLTIAITTVLTAVGTAPVPSASLFVLAAVLQTFGVTAEQTALIVGFILPFDRILDMTRTVPNNTADLAVATAVARWEKEIDVDVFKRGGAHE